MFTLTKPIDRKQYTFFATAALRIALGISFIAPPQVLADTAYTNSYSSTTQPTTAITDVVTTSDTSTASTTTTTTSAPSTSPTSSPLSVDINGDGAADTLKNKTDRDGDGKYDKWTYNIGNGRTAVSLDNSSPTGTARDGVADQMNILDAYGVLEEQRFDRNQNGFNEKYVFYNNKGVATMWAWDTQDNGGSPNIVKYLLNISGAASPGYLLLRDTNADGIADRLELDTNGDSVYDKVSLPASSGITMSLTPPTRLADNEVPEDAAKALEDAVKEFQQGVAAGLINQYLLLLIMQLAFEIICAVIDVC